MKKSILILLSFYSISAFGQVDSNQVNKQKLRTLQIGTASIYGIGMYQLAQVWFFHNDKSSFHTVNDLSHWNQMDKIGHATSANSISEKLYYGMRWAGIKHKKASIQSSIIGLLMVTSIDIMDGFSTAYGFSWPDIFANTIGSGLLVGQNLVWGEQKMIIKWSYQRTPEVALNPADLGDKWTNEWLHNYNGQTYWFTLNANHWLKPTKTWQKVLGIAVGKGAGGMYLETSQLEQDSLGGKYNLGERYHEWYLSIDLDLSHIKTPYPLLNKFFLLSRIFKTPMPTLSYSGKNGFQFKPYYF